MLLLLLHLYRDTAHAHPVWQLTCISLLSTVSGARPCQQFARHHERQRQQPPDQRLFQPSVLRADAGAVRPGPRVRNRQREGGVGACAGADDGCGDRAADAWRGGGRWRDAGGVWRAPPRTGRTLAGTARLRPARVRGDLSRAWRSEMWSSRVSLAVFRCEFLAVCSAPACDMLVIKLFHDTFLMIAFMLPRRRAPWPFRPVSPTELALAATACDMVRLAPTKRKQKARSRRGLPAVSAPSAEMPHCGREGLRGLRG